MKVKRTERGWAGHFICANRCRFRRNTLLEYGKKRIVVSTVGLMEKWNGDPRRDSNIDGFEPVGLERYFETMAFHANNDQRYYDADVSRMVSFESEWAIRIPDADDKANDMHEAVCEELTKKLLNGEL
jgi:hypothetical protein